MGLFGFFRAANINAGMESFRCTPNAVLLDVRSREEYAESHIKNSINLPLTELDKVELIAQDKSIPVFTYCHSGARSRRAAAMLRAMGYASVTDIGGIANYQGKVESL